MPLPDRLIYSADDVLAMLGDLLADATDTWWDGFFADRAKPIPFVVDWPDENLADADLYRFITRRRCCDLRIGQMSRLRQDRGLCPFACST